MQKPIRCGDPLCLPSQLSLSLLQVQPRALPHYRCPPRSAFSLPTKREMAKANGKLWWQELCELPAWRNGQTLPSPLVSLNRITTTLGNKFHSALEDNTSLPGDKSRQWMGKKKIPISLFFVINNYLFRKFKKMSLHSKTTSPMVFGCLQSQIV